MSSLNSYRTAPGLSARAVTPDDNADLPLPARSLWVGVAGNLNVILLDDTAPVLFVDVVGLFPFEVKRVLVTSTTATSIVAVVN